VEQSENLGSRLTARFPMPLGVEKMPKIFSAAPRRQDMITDLPAT